MTASADPSSSSRSEQRLRRRRLTEVKQRLRELRVELSVLDHRIGAQVALKQVDFDCLDVVDQHGPISPSVLARRVGVRLATMTGILDRLERNGWITRSRDETDRRGVIVRAVPDRQRDIYRLYGGMNRSLDRILGSYSAEQIDVIVDFLQRCTKAGHDAADRLGNDNASP
jgi:DNA-binding MarR family transcriptional regulator